MAKKMENMNLEDLQGNQGEKAAQANAGFTEDEIDGIKVKVSAQQEGILLITHEWITV